MKCWKRSLSITPLLQSSMSLLYSSEHQGLSQSPQSGKTHVKHSLPVHSHQHVTTLLSGKLEWNTRWKSKAPQYSSCFLCSYSRWCTSKSWLRCLIIHPSPHTCFAFRHLWWKIASSIHFSPMHWAEHAQCSKLLVRIFTATLPQKTQVMCSSSC